MDIEEAIEKLNKFNEYENTVVLTEEALYEFQEAIETILKELEKKDKIIDLMAVTILQRDIGKAYCEFNKKCEKCEDGSRDLKCKDCIKQYFERKVEDERYI